MDWIETADIYKWTGELINELFNITLQSFLIVHQDRVYAIIMTENITAVKNGGLICLSCNKTTKEI